MIIQNSPIEIAKIGIVGAGTMGASIAVAISKLGLPIKLIDKEPDALKNGLQRIDQIFAKLKDKHHTKGANNFPDLDVRHSLIQPSNNFDDFHNMDLIIEAVNEDLGIKKSIFQTLDKICQSKTIFSSNTSSFSITQLASFMQRPKQVIGIHFFNPAHIMPLVEIVPGLNTAPETLSTAINFIDRLGKSPIQVEDCASFFVNRLLSRYINEAIWILQLGLADIKTIDDAACQMLMPVGPLQLRDMNGLDIGLAVAQFNYNEYGERFKPPPLLPVLVEKGLLGKKSGAGFYIYKEIKQKSSTINPLLAELITISEQQNIKPINLPPFEPIQLFLPMINETFLLLQEKIIKGEDIDQSLKAGLGMKKGLLEFAFEFGLNNCLAKIEKLHQAYGERFRPAPLLKRYVWAEKKSL